MFRARPLTWLFVIATGCVDLAMILPPLHSPNVVNGDLPRLIFMWGVPAQLSLVAAWSAIGNGHRLARGAILTLGVFLAALLTAQFSYSWRDLLSFYMVHIVLVCGIALLMNSAGWLPGLSPLTKQPKQKFQFPVVEMFGWTCIVAIWSFAGRHARIDDDFYGLFFANSVTIPLFVIALLGRLSGWWFRVFLLLLAYGAAIFMARLTAGRFDSDVGFVLLGMNLTQVTYLALWCVVRRLDDVMQIPTDDLG